MLESNPDGIYPQLKMVKLGDVLCSRAEGVGGSKMKPDLSITADVKAVEVLDFKISQEARQVHTLLRLQLMAPLILLRS